MSLLKQFIINQRVAAGYADKEHLRMSDASSLGCIDALLETFSSENKTDSTALSYFIALTAYRFSARAQRLLHRCTKEPEKEEYSTARMLELLTELRATLQEYASYEMSEQLPESAKRNVEDITNELFACLANYDADAPTALAERMANQPEVIESLRPFAIADDQYEPIFSPTYQEFQTAIDRTRCILAPSGKYWGADDWDESLNLEENAAKFAKGFWHFMAVAHNEKFKGFAFRTPAHMSDTLDKLSQTVAFFLQALNKVDPAKSDCLDKDISEQGWKYSWGGETMFLTAFGTCYPEKHPRNPYGFDKTYFFFQPDFVLRAHPSLTGGKEDRTRRRILESFEDEGMTFDNTGKEKEQQRYIRPIEADDPAVHWWEHIQ